MCETCAPLPAAPLYTHPLFQRLTGGAWRPGGLALTRHGLDLCGFTAGMRVLDVGCGAGATLELLRARGVWAVGLDRVPHGGAAPMLCAHAARLPLAANVLDGLVCECVLSLLQEAEDVLAGFARVLRPGGALLLSDLCVSAACSASCPEDSRPGPSSCMDGAMPRQRLETALMHSGFSITHYEDHTALLKPLAAQLVWHGLHCAGRSGARMGYGLWIARRI